MYQDFNERKIQIEIEYAVRADLADDSVVPRDGLIKVIDYESTFHNTDRENIDKWLICKRPTKRTNKRQVKIKF